MAVFRWRRLAAKKKSCKTSAQSAKSTKRARLAATPVSATAGMAIINYLSKNRSQIYPKLEKNASELQKALVDLAANYKLPAQVYSIASLYQIFFTNENVTDYACAKHSDAAMFTAYFQDTTQRRRVYSTITV